ncbi:hypothetical protein H8356DRAFT_1325011 [Neocallimastix lanati (nom. inval.)]|nr:hypothetical protein H8356DRAFT_1325011 [Neocallimastix sp. JGI-2020a]
MYFINSYKTGINKRASRLSLNSLHIISVLYDGLLFSDCLTSSKEDKTEKTKYYIAPTVSSLSILNISFRWVFHTRSGYRFDARVAKAANTTVQNNVLVVIEKIVIFDWNIGFLNDIFLILFENFYIITKYCPISNSNVNTVVTDMNNIESSTDSNSSNEVYKINNNYNNINSVDSENRIININDHENNSVITNNVVNWSIGENFVYISNFLNNEDVDIVDLNYKKEWDVFLNNQIISKIITRVSIRQGLLFRWFNRKLARSVNTENAVRLASRANTL